MRSKRRNDKVYPVSHPLNFNFSEQLGHRQRSYVVALKDEERVATNKSSKEIGG